MVAQTRTPRSTWIEADWRSPRSPAAVRVDLLSKALGVTRGGFYWHFASRQDFSTLLDAWEHRNTDEVLERVEEGRRRRDKVHGRHAHDLAIVFGKRAGVWDALLYFLSGVTISFGVMTAGPIVTFGFLVIPPLTARLVTSHMLAFSLAIGSHFIAADHDGRSRRQVLERATQRLLA
jgi:AcrR family transcriptional regulator